MHNKKKLVLISFTIIFIGILLIAGFEIYKFHTSLNGVYQEINAGKDDDGYQRSDYMKFTRNGKVEEAHPETGNKNSGTYGSAGRGTYKYIGNNKFKVRLKDVYDSDYYDFTIVKIDKNSLEKKETKASAPYHWGASSWAFNQDVSTADFNNIFKRAATSDQQKVQNNGYAKPHN